MLYGNIMNSFWPITVCTFLWTFYNTECKHGNKSSMNFHISKSSFTRMFICTQFIDQLPVGLLAQLVERCTGIFQVLFTTTRFSSVLSCEDLLISSFHRSANIWIFIYLKRPYYFTHRLYVFFFLVGRQSYWFLS